MADAPKHGTPTLRFDYLKSNFFRVIHADGVVGGPTPNGTITFSLFNERSPIPQQVEHAVVVQPDQSAAMMGEEIREHRISRDAIVREVEVAVVMDYRTAASFHRWLGSKLEALKDIEALRRAEPLP